MMRAGETRGFVDNSNAARATRQGSCKITRTCIPPGDQCVCAVRTCGGGGSRPKRNFYAQRQVH